MDFNPLVEFFFMLALNFEFIKIAHSDLNPKFGHLFDDEEIKVASRDESSQIASTFQGFSSQDNRILRNSRILYFLAP